MSIGNTVLLRGMRKVRLKMPKCPWNANINLRDTKHSHEHLNLQFLYRSKVPSWGRKFRPPTRSSLLSPSEGPRPGDLILLGVPIRVRKFRPPSKVSRYLRPRVLGQWVFNFVGSSDMVSEVPTNTLTAQQWLVFGPRVYIPLQPLHSLAADSAN